MWYCSLDLTFKAKLKFESRNRKIQHCHQVAILKVTSLKINMLLPIVTNMHMKFEIEIPKQSWVTLWKPCRLQTNGQTDIRTRWIQYTLPPAPTTTNFVGRGYKYLRLSSNGFDMRNESHCSSSSGRDIRNKLNKSFQWGSNIRPGPSNETPTPWFW